MSFPNLEIMAVDQNDSGSINIATRNVGISDDDYVTVLSRFDPFGKFPRIAYSGIGLDAQIFEDWDNGVFTFNQHPPVIVNITIDGEHGNYGTHVFSGTSKTFDMTATIILWPTSSSATWDWVLPAGWIVNSGATSGSGLTSTINVTAPHSPNTYEIQFIAQEDHGINWTAYRKVWIKSFTFPPLDLVRIDSHVDDRTGSKWTVTLNRLVGLPPGAMIHLFNAGTWNGVDVPTASKSFTGYVQRRRETTDVGVANVSLDLVGPSYLLELIGGQSQIMSAVNAIPTTWQQLYYTLSYLDFIIWWLLVNRAAGMIQMFNYTPFGLSNTQKRMTDWRIDAGTVLAQCQALAKRIAGGNFGCDPTGEFMLRVHPSRTPWSSRGGIPVRDSLNAGRYTKAELVAEPHPQVRRLRGECFVSDGLTTNTPYWCDAPIIPGQGAREEKLERLICDSTSEFYEVTGDDYQARNNPYPSGTISVPKNYAAIYPAQLSRLGLDVAPALRYDGVEYSGYVVPVQVSYTHNPDGTIDASIGVEAETVGLPATDVPIPQPDPSTLNSFYQSVAFSPIPMYRAPNFNPNPAGTAQGARVVPKDGSVGFCGSPTNAYLVTNVLGKPVYRDVTPSTLGSFQIQHGIVEPGGTRAYLLASDGTHSAVWSTPNLFASPKPTWSKGANVTGVFSIVRLTQTSGSILIYSPASSGWKRTFDFRSSSYSTYFAIEGGLGTYSPGTGYIGTDRGTGHDHSVVELDLQNFANTTLTRIDIVYSMSGGTGGPNAEVGAVNPFNTQTTPSNGTNILRSGSGSGAISGTVIEIATINSGDTGSATIVQVILYGTGSCPFSSCDIGPGGGNSVSALSTDFGATFASSVTVGASPGAVGGFDVQRSGTVAYAAEAAETRKASSLGGSYSDDQNLTANPVMIETPWYTRNSLSALNTGGSPEYIIGLDAPDGSSHTLYWIVGGSPVNITPSFGGNPGVSPGANNLTTWKGKYVAGLFQYAGLTRLSTSVDGASTWVDHGALNASYIRVRRLAKTAGQLFAVGFGAFVYSPDFGHTLVPKSLPPSTNLIFYEPVG